MEFSRQEYWSGLLFPIPGDLPHSGIEPPSPLSPALAGRFFTTKPPGKPSQLLGCDYFLSRQGPCSPSERPSLLWEELMVSVSLHRVNNLYHWNEIRGLPIAGKQCLTFSPAAVRNLVQETEPSPGLATHSWQAFQEKGSHCPQQDTCFASMSFHQPNTGHLLCLWINKVLLNKYQMSLCVKRSPRTDVIEVSNC